MRIAVIRGLCALACALAFHAALVAVAVRLGWLAPDDATLPELDLTSVDLSFSDTPDETAAPAPPPPPPPDLPPNPHAMVVTRPAELRPTDVRPQLPEPPESVQEPKHQTKPEPERETKTQDVPPPQPPEIRGRAAEGPGRKSGSYSLS